MPVEDPLLCPEPRHTDDGRYWCEVCQEGKHSMGDRVRGCSFTPWEKPTEQWCGMPKAHCLKPPIGANRCQYLPFDEKRWCAGGLYRGTTSRTLERGRVRGVRFNHARASRPFDR